MALDFKARGSGPYVVYLDDVEYSRHTTEREAAENASEALEANPGAAVRYEHEYIVDVTETSAPVAPPVDPDPPVDPPPPPPPVPSAMANAPAWSVLVDEDFSGALSGSPDDWGAGQGLIAAVDEPTALNGRAWREIYRPHLSGTGPGKLVFGFPGAFQKLYISWRVMWASRPDAWDHNGTSEKWLMFNYGSGGRSFVFQLGYGVESIFDIPEAGPGSYPQVKDRLRANMAPVGTNHSGDPLAIPPDDQWVEYELLFDRTSGTVKWWRDGVLHAHHVGVSFDALSAVDIAATWGGGGDKQGTSERLTDYFHVRGA